VVAVGGEDDAQATLAQRLHRRAQRPGAAAAMRRPRAGELGVLPRSGARRARGRRR
jgi:hypothetical protein